MTCSVVSLVAPWSNSARVAGSGGRTQSGDSSWSFFTGSTLLRQAEMDGTSMAEWFKRQSPSKWMQGLMGEIRKGISRMGSPPVHDQAASSDWRPPRSKPVLVARHRDADQQLDGSRISPCHQTGRRFAASVAHSKARCFLVPAMPPRRRTHVAVVSVCPFRRVDQPSGL